MKKTALYSTIVLVSVFLPISYWYETRNTHIELRAYIIKSNKFLRKLEENYIQFMKERYKPYQLDV
jgi:hypothetical protein